MQLLDQLIKMISSIYETLVRVYNSVFPFPLNLFVAGAVIASALVLFLIIRRGGGGVSQVNVVEAEEIKPEPTVIDQYVLDDLISVKIVKTDGEVRYLVEEPRLDESLQEIVRRVEEQYVRKGIEPSSVLKDLELDEGSLKAVTYHVIKDIKGSWKLEPLMRDDLLEDITVTKPGPAYVVHRKYPDFGWIETNITFTAEELEKQARLLAERNGAELSIAKPSAEVMTHDGDRIAITYGGELTPGTSTITVRKFPKSPYTVLDLIRNGTVSFIVAAYIWTMLEAKKFVLIAGPTGSGKTTFLSALLQLLPSNSKILTLEDYHPEINLSWHRNWHRFVTRRTLGETAYSLADILRLSLRHRPDYAVVGEVRGNEARVMFSAAATGHGMASTIHADDLEDVYQRLTSVSMGVLKEELSLLDVVVLIRSTPRGRRVVAVWEVENYGKEHLVAWYDQGLNRFFPENWRQLIMNSPTLTRDEAMREQYELRVLALEKLLEVDRRLSAEEVARLVEAERRSWRELVTA